MKLSSNSLAKNATPIDSSESNEVQSIAKGRIAPGDPGARKLIANKQTNKQTFTHTIITLIPQPDPWAHQSFSFYTLAAAAAAAAATATAFFGNSIHLCNFHLNYSHQKCHG